MKKVCEDEYYNDWLIVCFNFFFWHQCWWLVVATSQPGWRTTSCWYFRTLDWTCSLSGGHQSQASRFFSPSNNLLCLLSSSLQSYCNSIAPKTEVKLTSLRSFSAFSPAKSTKILTNSKYWDWSKQKNLLKFGLLTRWEKAHKFIKWKIEKKKHAIFFCAFTRRCELGCVFWRKSFS